jgi:hypothetical protein
VFEEVNGVVSVEAEHFFKQTNSNVRAWYLFTKSVNPKVTPDGDPSHIAGASGGAYMEILPDTRRTHGDKLTTGRNFSNEPGRMAILHYKVHFNTPGKYYVWARIFSTTSEDNGLHVGIDGQWPESGRRMQWIKKQQWVWGSRQRTQKKHTGVPHILYLNVKKAGEHVIMFSMREDGTEFDKWMMIREKRNNVEGKGPAPRLKKGSLPKGIGLEGKPLTKAAAKKPPVTAKRPRGKDGDGSVAVTGELKQWHKVTLTLDGPFAHERDTNPNPFTDCRMTVTFKHESGSPNYSIAGYFAADGNASNTSAEAGTKWRAHVSPDKPGKWTYQIRFVKGLGAAVGESNKTISLKGYHGKSGSFKINPTDKKGRDFRANGRLQYVGKHYLRFAGSGQYFLKAGADAPETFLAYKDFDGTIARKGNVPLKTWQPHVTDWRSGDPSWKNGKGKGMIGALNYLSDKGCNVFSFLPYNAGGDGDNVWPFVARDEKLHYDCSKLDQWGIVFDHATARGLYLHFKLQETEMDDNRRGKGGSGKVPTSLNGGQLGIERKLYCRELIARYGHNLALNWNLGEENTQSTEEQRAMASYIAAVDPYGHNIVVHTYPGAQDNVYRPLLGKKSALTGTSLQNSHIKDTHIQTLKWVRESAKAGKPWIVAFDESGSAAHGQPPDLGYRGFNGKDSGGKMAYTQHEVRKQTLWGTLMAGGAGVEYYFGYKFAENDLICQDWRSRDRSWNYCRIAIEFFQGQKIPFWEMTNANALIDNASNDNSKYCLAKKGVVYVVYLANGGTTTLDLSDQSGSYQIRWFNPREGSAPETGTVRTINGGSKPGIGRAPNNQNKDWVVLIRRS